VIVFSTRPLSIISLRRRSSTDCCNRGTRGQLRGDEKRHPPGGRGHPGL